ncbi:hypothetical protein FUAX_31080 [Fulvitalea axinellae]|uniref:Putative auto-transporter adhesin head GIN domain-containing protein n=1 Tax=Fulvitalea axinellae TaxID=1182444 RepID=A0AAU9DC28_9BACT|nr:hypothetical protein FUAX_31080 [Fulvitalea axinellae]
MKRIASTFCLLLLAVLVTGVACAEDKDVKVSDFSSIKIAGPFKVTLVSGSPKVSLSGDEDDLEKVVVDVSGDRLTVRFDNKNWKWRNKSTGTIHVKIAYRNLKALQASGASTIKSGERIKATNFELDVSGASRLTLSLNATKLEMDASGASSVSLSGRVKNVEVDLSGASSCNMLEMECDNMEGELSGASVAKVNVRKSLDIEASGASVLKYKGKPERFSVDKSGASSARAI